jgi:hypothetical protein
MHTGRTQESELMHAKRQSSSETTHVVQATIGHLVKSFLRAFTREKRYPTCFKFRFVSSPLYVVDGSSFATSAAVNPTSTIGALALRAADQIWAEQKS